MQRDFTQTLTDLDGRPIALNLNEDGTVRDPATLGAIATIALMAPKMVDGDAQPASGAEALRALDLALRIRRADGPIEVSAEDTVYVKDRIAAHFTAPLIVGMAWRMLEA